MSGNTMESRAGLPAKEFEKLFRKAGVFTDGLDSAKSANAKATRIGKFLTPYVNQIVPICVGGRTGRATLCMCQARAKQKLYYFEVRWDDADVATPTTSSQITLDDGLAPAISATTPACGGACDSHPVPPIDEGTGNAEQW